MYRTRIEALEARKLFSITDWIIDPIAAASPAAELDRAAIVGYIDANEVAAPVNSAGRTDRVGNSSLNFAGADLPPIAREIGRYNEVFGVNHNPSHASTGDGKLLGNLLTAGLAASDEYFAKFSKYDT